MQTNITKDQLKSFLRKLIFDHPKSYYRKFVFDENKLYLEAILEYTPLLNDPIYKISTKIYWILNDIISFDDPRCICHNSKYRKNGEGRNVASVFYGYKDHCCVQCRYESDQRIRRLEETYFKRTGYKNPSQNPTVKQQKEQTTLEHLGVRNPAQSPIVQKKMGDSLEKKIGVRHITYSEDFWENYRKTSREHFGVDHPTQCKEISDKQRKRYIAYFDGKSQVSPNQTEICQTTIYFDSAPELALFIWLSDNKKDFVYQPDVDIQYEFNGKQHRCFPDFMIDGQLYEVKGSQFLKEDGTWQNPFDHSLDKEYEAKHQCELNNGVKFIYSDDYQIYLDYVSAKYGKSYLKFFKNGKAHCRKNKEKQLVVEFQDS